MSWEMEPLGKSTRYACMQPSLDWLFLVQYFSFYVGLSLPINLPTTTSSSQCCDLHPSNMPGPNLILWVEWLILRSKCHVLYFLCKKKKNWWMTFQFYCQADILVRGRERNEPMFATCLCLVSGALGERRRNAILYYLFLLCIYQRVQIFAIMGTNPPVVSIGILFVSLMLICELYLYLWCLLDN